MNKLLKYFTSTDYLKATTWRDVLVNREEQKRQLQEESLYRDIVNHGVTEANSHHGSQIVFSRDDAGHTGEESQKIQQIYTELGNVPFSGALAF